MDTDTAWVRPAPGIKVRKEDPTQGHLPEEGAHVPLTSYYRRRLKDGDVVRGRRPGKPAEADPAKGKDS